MASVRRAQQFVVQTFTAAFAHQPSFERTILTKLSVVLLNNTYLTELVPPHTVPSLGDRHFQENVTYRHEFPGLSPFPGMRTTAKNALEGL